MLMFSEQRTGHPTVQTLTPLNVFESICLVRSSKCNQLLRLLNFGDLEEYSCRFVPPTGTENVDTLHTEDFMQLSVYSAQYCTLFFTI